MLSSMLSSCAAAARFNGEAAVVASRCCMQAPFAAASCAQIILWIPNRSIPVAPATLPLATFFPTTFRQLHFAAVIALAQPAVPERKSGIKKTPTLRRQTRTSTAGAIQRYRVWANLTFSYHDRLD
mgnify:CR=1 FL=1